MKTGTRRKKTRGKTGTAKTPSGEARGRKFYGLGGHFKSGTVGDLP